jgi:glycosyltransferase involved in cell wall biosynthesis
MTVVKTVLKREQIDLVTTQSPFDDGLLGVWLKQKFGIPLNVQMRSSFLDLPFWIKERPIIYWVFNVLGKWVSCRADTIRVVSYGEKQRLEEKFPELQGKIVALHPLVNVQTFTQPLQPEEQEQVQCVLQQHGKQGTPFLLFVGRLVPQKNLPTLLQAFALVHRKTENVALVIAGDGFLHKGLKQMAKQLHLDNHIIWLGNRPLKTLRGWYGLARATMLPSFHEGVAKVILESYLMGTPVIATPFVCAKELFQNGETGFVLQSFTNSNELAEKMACLLDSPDLAKEMGKKGKAHITRYLLPEETYMERLLEIWETTARAKNQK